MNDISGINGGRGAWAIVATAPTVHRNGATAAAASDRRLDTVELSITGMALAQRHDDTIRVEKVARIRSEIQSGVYDVDGKIEAILDRVHEALFQ